MCNTAACVANRVRSDVTLSEKRAPTAINRSQPDTHSADTFVPCMPTIPVYWPSSCGYAPMPINVAVTGAPVFFASSASSASASAAMMPPPAMISGRLALLIASTAFLMSSGVNALPWSHGSGSAGVYSYSCADMFLGTSTSTGPLRPLFAIRNAWRMLSARCAMSLTIMLCLVMGEVTPAMSISWKLSLPSRSMLTLDVMATTGTESI